VRECWGGGRRQPHVCNKKAVLPQGNRAMPQVFFSVEVRQQHSLHCKKRVFQNPKSGGNPAATTFGAAKHSI